MKMHEKNMVFRGNTISDVTADTSSDQGILFGTFLMKNIFINFPTPILNHIFCSISSKNAMFFIGFVCTTMLYSHITIKFASKNHEIFNEIEQKTWFKIGVGKLMNIFFMSNVSNNIPWSQNQSECVSGDVWDDISSKNHEIFMFFHVFWLL